VLDLDIETEATHASLFELEGVESITSCWIQWKVERGEHTGVYGAKSWF